MNRCRRLWSVPAGVLLAGSLVAGAGTVDLAAAAVAGPVRVSIELTAVRPTALTPGSDLVVTGRVRNASAAALRGLRVGLRVQPGRLTTREDVQAWSAADPLDAAGTAVGAVRDLATLRPARAAGFRLSVPATALGLPAAAEQFGPRGIAVEVTDGAGVRAGLARSSVVWYPGRAFRPTRLSLLVTITPPGPTRAAAEPSAALDGALRPGGRLDHVLDAAATPGLDWVVDPATLLAVHRTAEGEPAAVGAAGDAGMVATERAAREGTGATPSAAGSGSTPAATPDTARQPARTWLERFRAGSGTRTVAGLPFADVDIAALTRRKGAALVRRADELGREAAEDALDGGRLDTTLALPAAGAADAATLNTLARSGRTAVVLADRVAPPEPELGYTASGLTRIRTRDGQLTGLLADRWLSAGLGDAGGPGSVAATQQMLSELAAITLERPSDQRSLLAVGPRQWDPDPDRVRAAVAALRAAPWVELRSVQQLRAEAVPDLPRQAPAYPPSARAGELGRTHVADVIDADRRLTRFAPALTEQDRLLRPLREEALSVLSVAWRGLGRTAQADARRPLRTDVTALENGVVVVEGGPYNLLTASGELPIRVRSRLPYPLTLRVRLQPRSGQLVADRAAPVELGPLGSRVVLVPARTVANGNVTVDATVRTPEGAVLGEPTRVEVRVRRNWESRGILAVGGLLALLLLTGLFRSVRRGRVRVPAGSVPDVDEQAIGRARATSGTGPGDDTAVLSLPIPTGAGPPGPARTPVPDRGPPEGASGGSRP